MTPDERLARMERLIEAIAKKLCVELDEGASEEQHRAAFDRAVAELASGNRKPLGNYIRKGGKIPC